MCRRSSKILAGDHFASLADGVTVELIGAGLASDRVGAVIGSVRWIFGEALGSRDMEIPHGVILAEPKPAEIPSHGP